MKEKVADKIKRDYSKILQLVTDGWNISKAVSKCGITTSSFYKHITELQKAEIYAAKKLHTKYGVGSRKYYTS